MMGVDKRDEGAIIEGMRRNVMMKFVLGCVFGWFTHLHYGEAIIAGIRRATGGV